MIPSIAEVVSQFKREWTNCLAPEAISNLCREAGLSWRERLLTPATTIQLMLLQVLHGNTAIGHLPRLAKLEFWPSSFCRARMRIPLTILEILLQRIADFLQLEDYNKHTWLGHRVFIADGTAVSMPDTSQLESAFGYQSRQLKGATFPVSRLVFMLHLGTGMIAKVLINPFRSHEARFVADLHPELRENDIFLADRAFCSYTHFCLLLQRGAHALIRMNAKMLSSFATKQIPKGHRKPLRLRKPDGRVQLQLLGKSDHIVQWNKPTAPTASMTPEQYRSLPESIVVRELLYRIQQKGFRSQEIIVLTTLLDVEKYPPREIAALYKMRWQIETNFNHLKTTMKMDILRAKTADGIRKEIYAFCIIYNLVRLVMIQAAKQHRVPVSRISFADALRWLAAASPGQPIIRINIVPHRPGRFEPRSRKRRPKPGYPCLMMPRQELRKKKLTQMFSR